MRKSILIICFLISVSMCLTAQNGTWTWMSGTTVNNFAGSFGVQTVAAPGNQPPSLYEAAEWQDLAGNFWFLGGSDPTSIYAAMWRYNPTTNLWTWMKGPQGALQPGIYGVQGIPAPGNYPGGRTYGAVTWTDLAGNLWLYGGVGYDINGTYGALNDLWRYSIATNEWTWIKGSPFANDAGFLGVLQTPSPINNPPSHQEAVARWVDQNGDLWMFNGDQLDVMWRYSIAANEWTWMSGSASPFTPVNFGVQGVPAATNTPGSRWIHSSWKDQQGRFWMYGGYDFTGNYRGDMWMYDPATNFWTWMAGTQTLNDPGTFTQTCVPGGYPAALHENRSCWTDVCGRFWSYGGNKGLGMNAEMWLFDPATLQFTWITGSPVAFAAGNYGTIGIPAPTNVPPALGGALAFQGSNGEMWLWGGAENGITMCNAVWRYQPDPLCPAGLVDAAFTVVPDTAGCAPLTLQFLPFQTGLPSYSWDFGIALSGLDTSSSDTASWTFTQPGTYTVTLIANSPLACNGGVDTSVQTIVVFPNPVVDLGADTSYCTPQTVTFNAAQSGATYNWNTGDTTASITTSTTGLYVVLLTDSNGCIDTDSVIISILNNDVLSNSISLCGAVNGLILDAGAGGTSYLWSTGETTQFITVTEPGIYSVTIITPACTIFDSVQVAGAPGEGALYIPNSFTPNGDGLNETFTASGTDITSFQMQIFNRWGELIFETSSQLVPWDGRVNDTLVQEDVYVVVIEYTSICSPALKRRYSHVSVIR
ncbi:MAG: kelch repeat-containing protein [Bacteroidia bacterium]